MKRKEKLEDSVRYGDSHGCWSALQCRPVRWLAKLMDGGELVLIYDVGFAPTFHRLISATRLSPKFEGAENMACAEHQCIICETTQLAS